MSRKYEISSRINNAKQIEQQMNNLVAENAKLEQEIRNIEAQLSKIRQQITEAQTVPPQNSNQGEGNNSQLNDWNTFHLQEKASSLEKELNIRKNKIAKNLEAIGGLSASLSQEKSNLENILQQEHDSGEKRKGEIRSLDPGKIGNEATKREYNSIERSLDKAYAANLENSNMINAYLGKPQAEKQVFSFERSGNRNFLPDIIKTFEPRAFYPSSEDHRTYHSNSSTLEDKVLQNKTSPTITKQSSKNSSRHYGSIMFDYLKKQ